MWNLTQNLFREHINSLEQRQWQNIPSLDKYAQKLLEPILQLMTSKEKERRETHLPEMRIDATCVEQIHNGERGAAQARV